MPQARPSAPIMVRIGVTGHRRLAHAERLTGSVRRVLARLDAMLRYTPHTYRVVSPLAEGADRLVAQAVLDWPVQEGLPPPALIVPLPLPEAEYAEDFVAAASQEQFESLLARASERFVLSPAADAARRLRSSRPSCGAGLRSADCDLGWSAHQGSGQHGGDRCVCPPDRPDGHPHRRSQRPGDGAKGN